MTIAQAIDQLRRVLNAAADFNKSLRHKQYQQMSSDMEHYKEHEREWKRLMRYDQPIQRLLDKLEDLDIRTKMFNLYECEAMKADYGDAKPYCSEPLATLQMMILTKLITALKAPKRQQNKTAPERFSRAARVYIFLFEDDRLKIGISGNVAQRKKTLENGSGLRVVKWCMTVATVDAWLIEYKCHHHFRNNRCTFGEFFKNVSFDEARNFLGTLAELEAYREAK